MIFARFSIIAPIAFIACGAGGLLSFQSHALAEELDFPSGASEISTTKQRNESLVPKSSSRRSGFSVVLPSVVVHGIRPGNDVASEMTRKLDASGTTVVTPGLGLQYESASGFMAVAAGFKDCYDNEAGTFQLGQVFRFGKDTRMGYSVGIYARETPIACQTVTTSTSTAPIRGSRGPASTSVTEEECYEFDSYPLRFLTTINGVSVDIIPMPFLHFSTPLIKTRDFQVDFKIMSNFVLNEFGLGIPF